MGDEGDFILHEGKRYARVSAVIKPYADFSGINPAVLKAKAAIGTIVHKAIDDDINGELPDVPTICKGYFLGWYKWKKQVNPTFIETETRYFDDKLMITGQIDGLITMPHESVPTLVDWKTSVSESPTWVLQAHIYGHLLANAGKVISDRYLFIKLDKFLDYKVFSYAYDDNTHKFAMACIEKYWSNVDSYCH